MRIAPNVPKDPIVDEAVLPVLLDRFYGSVRRDPALGPVFNDAVDDWPSHMVKLRDFWSSIMLTSGRYKGNPMVAHMKHVRRLTAPMFDRWLVLWHEATEAVLPPPAAAAMQAKAERIADSLQRTLKLSDPLAVTPPARAVSVPYKSTPDFDTDSLPAALRRDHSTKAGAWGVIRVLEGCVRYVIAGTEALLSPGIPGLIRPQELHHVEPVGPMRMRVEFYDHEPVLN